MARVRQAGVLKVAIDPSYPPFAFLDAAGQVVGYDADLASELADRLGVKTEFIGIDVASVHDALIARKADVAISAVSPAWEYSKEIGYSQPYFNAGQVLLVRDEDRLITGPDQLQTQTVGVEIGSAGEQEGRKIAGAKPGITLVPFASLENGIEGLFSGKLDAVIVDRVLAAELTHIGRSALRAGEPFTFEPYVVATRASDRSLLREIDAVLEAMRTNGSVRGLDRLWIGPGP